ncbi:DUF1642 domain-containing protein [Listeria booriae]|uniref:DUF1642 domain-containing protein n=1 Tax=Listeria booriae TaxID=1552123 RepID=UPI00162397F5|nr:DUF1642 domain-containing protein [Listeria booriae]MBC2258876.1 DUF1642 domain-containing protein [Listeria booriae]
MTAKFKVGDRVHIIFRNELKTGVVISTRKLDTDIATTNEENAYLLDVEGLEILTPEYNVAPAPALVVVPSFIDDYIKNSPHLTSYGAIRQVLHPDSTENILADELVNWVARYSEKFARAWRDGYEVKKEQLYMVELPNLAYQTYLVKSDDGILAWQNTDQGTKFTEQEIKAIDERYWQFAVPVEEVSE